MKFTRSLLVSLLLTVFISVGATTPQAPPTRDALKQALKTSMNSGRWDIARRLISSPRDVLTKNDYTAIFSEFSAKNPNEELTSVMATILDKFDSFPAMNLDKNHPWKLALNNSNSSLISLIMNSNKFDLATLITKPILEGTAIENVVQIFSLTKPDILRRFASEKNEVGFLAASFLYFHPLSPEMPPASGLDADFKLRLENLKAGDHNVANCPEPQRLALASCAAAWGRVHAFQNIYATAQPYSKKHREFISIAIAMAAFYENMDIHLALVPTLPRVNPSLQEIGNRFKSGIEQIAMRQAQSLAIRNLPIPANSPLAETHVFLMYKNSALEILSKLGQENYSISKSGMEIIEATKIFKAAFTHLSHDLHLKQPLTTDEKVSAMKVLKKFNDEASKSGILGSVKNYVNHLGMSTIGAKPFYDCKKTLKDQQHLLLKALGCASTIPNDQKSKLFQGTDVEVVTTAKQLLDTIAHSFALTDEELRAVADLVLISQDAHPSLIMAWTNLEDERNPKNFLDLYKTVMQIGRGSSLLEVATKEIARLEAAKITTDRDGSGSESDSGSDSESGSDSDDTDEEEPKPETGKRKPTTRKRKPTTRKPKPTPTTTGKPKPAKTGKPKPADPANPTNASDTTTITTDNTTTSTSDASQNSSGRSIAMYILLAVVVLLVIGGAVVFLHPGLRRSIMGGGSDYDYEV